MGSNCLIIFHLSIFHVFNDSSLVGSGLLQVLNELRENSRLGDLLPSFLHCPVEFYTNLWGVSLVVSEQNGNGSCIVLASGASG